MDQLDYHDFVRRYRDADLSARKNSESFVRRLAEHLGFDLAHEGYKAVFRGSGNILSDTEYKVRDLYDAYVYLIGNPALAFSAHLLGRFFYILTGREIPAYRLAELQSAYYAFGNGTVFERILETHFAVYRIFKEEQPELTEAAAFMVLNHLLVRNRLTPLRFSPRAYAAHAKVQESYLKGDVMPAVSFLLDELAHERIQPKRYARELKPLTAGEILKTLREDRELLTRMYQVHDLILFGSFARKTERTDSDIDLAVVFEEDISYEEKEACAEGLRRHVYARFSRYADVQEINGYMEEKLLTGFRTYLKVF